MKKRLTLLLTVMVSVGLAQAEPVNQTHTINKRYLIWPVQRQAKGMKPDCRFFLYMDDALFTFADVQLPQGKPDFWVFTDLSGHQGKVLRIQSDLHGDYRAAFQKVTLSNTVPGMRSVYHEALRPQYHFTSKRGWLNDTNGMTYYAGEWHLFYQHNPYNWHWCNISWGHAVSNDLLHWEELPDAIVPGPEGVIYSGSGAVDFHNHAGFQTGSDKAMIAAYTGNGLLSYELGLNRVQCLSYSNDRGRTWTKYSGNPVIENQYNAKDRDPKIFWYQPSQHWVMIDWENRGWYHINISEDMKNWAETGAYKSGGAECPDMFEMPVDGDWNNTRWVVWSGNGRYKVGSFDGRSFTEETDVQQSYWGQAYAGQTFSHAPDGRHIHMGWLRYDKPGFDAGHVGMPFNQQLTLPLDFTLCTTDSGLRLFIQPIPELQALRDQTRIWTDLTVKAGADPLADVTGTQVEIEAEIDLQTATSIAFNLRGQAVRYSVTQQELDCLGQCLKVAPDHGKIKLHLFLDTTSVEVFVNDGYAYLSAFTLFDGDDHAIGISVEGGSIRVPLLKVHGLKSIWP